MENDLDMSALSRRAQAALSAAKAATRSQIERLSRHDLIVLPCVSTKTADEIVAWAATHGIQMPDWPKIDR